jgi:hypothetical protein
MNGKKPGQLDVGRSVRSGGKVVDEWRFLSPFRGHGDEPKPPKLKVEIAVIKEEKGITFEARGVEFNFVARDQNIELLRQKVEEELRFQHDLLTGAPWEDWLEIEVSGKTEERTQSLQANVQLKYTVLKRAVDPRTGKAYYLHDSNHVAIKFPEPKAVGEMDEGDTVGHFTGLNRRNVDSEYSYLPATPENIAALKDLQNRLEELRLRMSAFLNQGTVQKSLANLASGALSLPAPL